MKNILLTTTLSITIVTLFLAPAGTNLAFAGVTCEEQCIINAEVAFDQCMLDINDLGICEGIAQGIFITCTEQCPVPECQTSEDCGPSSVCSQFICELDQCVQLIRDGTPCGTNNACETNICIDESCRPNSATICDDLDACTDDSCDPDLGCQFEPNTDPVCQPPTDTVAGELLPIMSSALIIAGVSTIAIWMVPAVVGLAGAGVYLIKFRARD